MRSTPPISRVRTMGSLLVISSDGREVEAAMIGHEGAIGGIVSAGHKPAYARAVVQIGGPAFSSRYREKRGCQSALARHARFVLALCRRAVGANDAICRLQCLAFGRSAVRALAALNPRPRAPARPSRLTQEALAEMLGVQRTTFTAVIRVFSNRAA